MKTRFILNTVLVTVLATLLPALGMAQSPGGLAGSIGGLQPVLDEVYNEMLPLCSKLIGVARGLAGFGALWYISARVWRHIASAEPVDFYPLLRPFALGLAIILFPLVIAMMNGVLQPVVSATAGMVRDSDKAIAALLKQKEAAIKKSRHWQMYVGESGNGDKSQWYKYTFPKDPNGDDQTFLDRVAHSLQFHMDKQLYNFRNSVKQWMSEVLQVLFAAAALCINTIRTFYLIVLAILGPLVFGFAVFDGFQHTLTVWIARYVNIFMWLPVANIFGSILGKIQENMLKIDISQIGAEGDTFFSTHDTAYLVFLVIGIVGYFTVPNVANYIVHAGGGNAILTKVNSLVTGSASTTIGAAKKGGGMIVDRYNNNRASTTKGMAEASANDYFKDKVSGN